jgi:signal transduction histidine kinase
MAESETYIVGPDERADLHAACVDVVAFLAPLVFEQGKSISVTGAEMPVWVIGNPEMIARAVRNLVENAIKYSPAGGDIEVAVAAQGAVHVIDQGPGIGDDEKQLLFRRFWRRDRRGPNSIGLGLSIVQRIMEAHAGTVEVRNRTPRGTEFVLKFRAADVAVPMQATTSHVMAKS